MASPPAIPDDQVELLRGCSRDSRSHDVILEVLSGLLTASATEQGLVDVVLQTPDIILIEFGLDGAIRRTNHGCECLADVTAAELIGRQAAAVMAPPEDRDYFESLIRSIAADAQPRRQEFHWQLRESRAIRWSLSPVTEDGVVGSIIAIGVDMSLSKKIEQRLFETNSEITAILDAFPDLTLRVSPEGVVLTYQGGARSRVLTDLEELPGRPLVEAFEPDVATRFASHLARALETRQTVVFDYAVTEGAGRIEVEARLLPLPSDQIFVILRDTTARQREKRSLEDLVAGTAEVTGVDFFPALVRHLSTALEVAHTCILEFIEPEDDAVEKGQPVPRLRVLAGEGMVVSGDGELKLGSRLVELLTTTDESAYVCGLRGELDTVDRGGLEIDCVLASPLWSPTGKRLGALCVFGDQPIESLQRARSIVHIFAARASAELSRLQAEADLVSARNREIAFGAKIQSSLLYGQPPSHLEGVSFAVSSVASQSIHGDFFDFVEYRPTCFDVIVGDVMGKGLSASLVGAATRSHFARVINRILFEGETLEVPTPAHIVTRLNADLTPELIAIGTFVTACYGRFDLEKQELTFVDCGHTKSVHYSARQDACRFLEGEGVPIGVIGDEVYREHTVRFEDGDVFLLYSDCVTETQDSSGEMFGDQRLADLIRKNAILDPDVLVSGLARELLRFSRIDEFQDDLTVLAIRIGAVDKEIPRRSRKLTQSGSLRSLKTWRQELVDFLEKHAEIAVAPACVREIELALTEAVVNVLKHGFQGELGREINAVFHLYGDRFVIELDYEGVAFDRAKVPPPDFDGNKSSGFGVYIIENTMDEVRYFSRPGGREVMQFVKKLESETY